jgi:hypothetical protein
MTADHYVQCKFLIAAYTCRVCPGRFTATYLLLLAIQRGYEAQAAAVDWILGRDWPQGVEGVQAARGSGDSPISSQGATPDEEMDTSSMETQQLLGRDAAEALQLADTATSQSVRAQQQQVARAVPHGQQDQEGGPADGAAAGGGGQGEGDVWRLLHTFVDRCQSRGRVTGMGQLIGGLRRITRAPADELRAALEGLPRALRRVRDRQYDVRAMSTLVKCHASQQPACTSVRMFAASRCRPRP